MTEEELAKSLMHDFRFSREQVTLGIKASFRCQYCGRDLLESVNAYDSWNTEHVVPTSKKGDPGPENWALACKTCNFIKGNWLPEDPGFRTLPLDEQIPIVRRHVQQKRAEKRMEIAKMRRLICDFLSQQDG